MIKLLDSIYLKLPALSEETKLVIIKALPVLSLIFGIFFILVSLLDLLGTPFISLLSTAGKSIVITIIINVLGIIQGLLMIIAFPTLRKRKMKGWRLFFWGQLLWILAAIISFSPAFIIALVVFYPLLQIRRAYN